MSKSHVSKNLNFRAFEKESSAVTKKIPKTKTKLKSTKHKLKAVAVKKKLKINTYGVDFEKNAKKCPFFQKVAFFHPIVARCHPE